MENRAIGIFDSGIGGLTVLKQIKKILPNENIIYYGDNLNNPYGNKPKKKIFDLSFKIINFLIEQNVKIIVIACNTVSATCFCELNKIFGDRIKIMEIIKSGVEAGFLSVEKNNIKNKNIVLLATEATVKSNVYQKYFYAKDPQINFCAKACGNFVSLAEQNLFDAEISFDVLNSYLEEFKVKKINSLILGCTHFPLFKNQIQKILPSVEIVDPAEILALHTKEYLSKNKILNVDKKPKIIFYTSGDVKKFRIIANEVLNFNYPSEIFVHKILK